MDDNVDEDSILELIVADNDYLYKPHDENFVSLRSMRIGECINVHLVVKYRAPCDKMDDLESWRRRVANLGVYGCLTPVPLSQDREGGEAPPTDRLDFRNCKICLSFIEGSDSKTVSLFQLKQKPYFVEKTVYVIPLNLSLTSVPGDCHRVQLSVAVWLSKTPTPTEWRTVEKDFCLSPDSANGLPPPAKTVTKQALGKCLDIFEPPNVQFRFANANGKPLILLKVSNPSREAVSLFNCWVLPSACHWATRSPTDLMCGSDGVSSDHANHGQVVSLLKTACPAFPLCLSPAEVLSLVFSVRAKELDGSDLAVSLAAHLSWCTQRSEHRDEPKTITTYSLPSLKVNHPPFVVSVACPEEVSVGTSFTATYTISNKLQDFIALRLYWSPMSYPASVDPKEDKQEFKNRRESTLNSIICQDPDVVLGECFRGSTVSAAVRFQVLQPGLFELGHHMKLNLRYALTSSLDSQQQEMSTPTDSTPTLSPDEQLVASEELWRDRSGSTSSVRSTGFTNHDERQQSFATKSYSFGDLGPASSTESDDTKQKKFKSIERSPKVPPVRPPPPKRLPQVKQTLNNPKNFLKKSYLMYVSPRV